MTVEIRHSPAGHPDSVTIDGATYQLLVEFLAEARDEAIRNRQPVVSGDAATLLMLLGSDR